MLLFIYPELSIVLFFAIERIYRAICQSFSLCVQIIFYSSGAIRVIYDDLKNESRKEKWNFLG